MLRVAIVEDEAECREVLRDMISQYAEEQQKQIRVQEFSDGSELVDNYKPDYDILLLDIEMPHLDGMKAAEKIRETDQDVVIVFITNMAQYAIKGYEVNALDFIIKPVNYSTFSMRFTRAIGRVKNREGRRVCLYLPDGPKWIDSREIYYIDIQNRMLHYHTPEGVYSVRGTLKDVQEQLADWNFVKCNQCYLVNLKFVSEIKKNFVVVAGTELEISRRNRNAFLAAVTDYLGS
jgi:DNA-binding LytR/AlgR family response regulator